MRPSVDNSDVVLVPWGVRQLSRAWLILRIGGWAHPCARISGCATDDSNRGNPKVGALGVARLGGRHDSEVLAGCCRLRARVRILPGRTRRNNDFLDIQAVERIRSITAMPFASIVLTGFTVGTRAGLTGSSRVGFQVRGSRKRSFAGARAPQAGIRRCRARVRPHDGFRVIASLRNLRSIR